MRNVTIERKKTFVACAMKMKAYIEDNVSGEPLVACRRQVFLLP